MNKENSKESMNEEVENQEAVENQETTDTAENSETQQGNDSQEEQLSAEETLKIEIAEWKNKYLRLHAEFDNFRKRTIKEKSDIIKSAGADVIKEMLAVVDDFDRAVIANENNEDEDAVKQGFILIRNKFLKTLEQKGVTPMDAVGKDFNTDHHMAITQLPGEEDMKNKVVDVVEKGYFIKDQVLRFAKVVVGS